MVLFAWLLEKAKTRSGQWLPRVVNEKGINYKGDQKSFWNERNVLFIHLRVSAKTHGILHQHGKFYFIYSSKKKMCLYVGKKRGQLDRDHCFLEVKI